MTTVRLPVIALVAALGAVAWSFGASAGEEAISFPSEYRTWAHVKSALIGPESPAAKTDAGIHHIYANGPALEGYRTGTFPDGAILVYDLLDVTQANGSTQEGAQKRVDVMVKDRQRYKDTGGWGFARYWPPSRDNGTLPPDRMAACYACHAKRKDRDGVFSELRK